MAKYVLDEHGRTVHLPYPSRGNPIREFIEAFEPAPARKLIAEPPAPAVSDTEVDRKLRVFLSYASEDRVRVQEVYEKLSAHNTEPWLDEENILPGTKWEDEIWRAMRASDVIVVCFSKHYTNKRGFTRKEINYALEVAASQPEGSIKFIPALLERIRLPEKVRHFQWVDLGDDRGYAKLMRSLRKQAENLKLREQPG